MSLVSTGMGPRAMFCDVSFKKKKNHTAVRNVRQRVLCPPVSLNAAAYADAQMSAFCFYRKLNNLPFRCDQAGYLADMISGVR